MSPAPAFEAAQAAGATLLLHGSRVEIDAPESVDERTLDAVAAVVARHKAAVVAALQAEAAAPRTEPPVPSVEGRTARELADAAWIAAASDNHGSPRACVVVLPRGYRPKPERAASTSGMVRCGDCRHYRPDPIGAGGIGTCSVEGEGVAGRPLYPRALRRCGDYLEVI